MKHWIVITIATAIVAGCGGDSSSSSSAGCDMNRIQGWWTGTYDVAWRNGLNRGLNWAIEIKGDTANFVGSRDRLRFSAPVRNCRMNVRVHSEMMFELCQLGGASSIWIQFNGTKAKGRFEGSCIDPTFRTSAYMEGNIRGRKR